MFCSTQTFAPSYIVYGSFDEYSVAPRKPLMEL